MSKQSGRDRYLTVSEVHQMIDAARSGRDKLLIRLLAYTGGRIEEVVRVRACDLLEEDRAIRLTNLKRKKGQVGTKLAAVPEHVIAAFHDYCRLHGLTGTAYVFAGRRPGTHLTQRQARNIVYQVASDCLVLRPQLRQAGMGPAWPHLLRHTLASQWVKHGVDISIIAKQLGHTQIRNTMEYLSVDIRDQRAAAERVPL